MYATWLRMVLNRIAGCMRWIHHASKEVPHSLRYLSICKPSRLCRDGSTHFWNGYVQVVLGQAEAVFAPCSCISWGLLAFQGALR